MCEIREKTQVVYKELTRDGIQSKGQVALEDNFRFVQDKSDLKSASDKKFVRKATVALENKICEQNITPCCERHAISREAAFTRCFNPQTATRGISKCFHEEF